LVSEAGLERLAKKLELEFIWENSMGGDDKKTLIIAGSALELLIEFSNNIVQSVALSFPDSAEIVNKHAEAAGQILFNDLRLHEGQSPLTKSLGSFAANFERLAVLDKLSINPGLNLYEAVAGIYESLCRLHAWELQKAREDPAVAAMGEQYLENLVTCTKSGKPTMNARGRVGMALEYWKEQWQIPPKRPNLLEWAEETRRRWSILIDCAPPKGITVNPVRISDKWIGPSVEKMPLPGDLHTDGPIIDWLEPESTFVPMPDPTKADSMQPNTSLLGPRLPDAVFHATFDPPVHVPEPVWLQIRQMGCMMDEWPLKELIIPDTFDKLVLPDPAGQVPQGSDSRTVTLSRKTPVKGLGATKLSLTSHANKLQVYKPELGRTLTGMSFSHPQQLITILPHLRQYAFLATLLENSFKEQPDPTDWVEPVDQKPPSTNSGTTTKTIITNRADYDSLKTTNNHPQPSTKNGAPLSPELKEENGNGNAKQLPPSAPQQQRPPQKEEPPILIDATLTIDPEPHFNVTFPFTRDRKAEVEFEVHENGVVHLVSQNVLQEGRNMVAANGRRRKVADVSAVLERFGDLGRWVEFMREAWAD
jgi:hypothetical protein